MLGDFVIQTSLIVGTDEVHFLDILFFSCVTFDHVNLEIPFKQ
jgi:hypothetical protein